VLAGEVWLTFWLEGHTIILVLSSLHYIANVLTAPAYRDGNVSWNDVANSTCDELDGANDTFYLIGSAAFQRAEYH
jgi:hypothetical protein